MAGPNPPTKINSEPTTKADLGKRKKTEPEKPPLPGHLELAVSPVVEIVVFQSPGFAPNRHTISIKKDRAGRKNWEQDEDRREHVALSETSHQLAEWGQATR